MYSSSCSSVSLIHPKLGNRDANQRRRRHPVAHRQTPVSTRCSRPLSWVSIARASSSSRGLPSDESVAFGNGIRREDDVDQRMRHKCRFGFQRLANSRRLAISEVGNQPCRPEVAADAAFDVFSRRHDGKVVTGIVEQLAPPRRTAGKDDRRLWYGHKSASYNLRMLDVLYEDNHLLVVNKPAMLPTMGVADDRPSLLAVAKEYVRQKYNKPGNVYLGIVSRLDAPVTGVVLLARTSKAAGRLSRAVPRARRREALLGGRRGPSRAPRRSTGRLSAKGRATSKNARDEFEHAGCPAGRIDVPRLEVRGARFIAGSAASDRPQAPDSLAAFARRFADRGGPKIWQHPAVCEPELPCIAGGWSSNIR